MGSAINAPTTKCEMCGEIHAEATVECVVQRMLVEYTEWVNGLPTPWNVKKAEGIAALKLITLREKMELAKGIRKAKTRTSGNPWDDWAGHCDTCMAILESLTDSCACDYIADRIIEELKKEMKK